MKIAIYGAQGIALGTYRAIRNIYSKRVIECFLVTERGMNDEYLDGIPVIELKDFASNMTQQEKDDIEILIATPENVMLEIEKTLIQAGFFHCVRMSSTRWSELMGYHFTKTEEFVTLRSAPIGSNMASIGMYMAKFYKDQKLNISYEIPKWISPIQVGAALTDERITDLLDCNGDNISKKNVNYSELTALYWIWKNILSKDNGDDEKDYYGLVHYRRILEFTEDDISRLLDNEIDVVLPYPMPYQPNIHAHHERYIKDADWNAMLTALTELQPLYAVKLVEIFKQQYFYNYNIILAKKSVLKRYCEWLFPILERTEELSNPKGCDRADRYIGYIGEALATLYFMVNTDRINIVHAGCKFLT